jgi:hypothetical protein
MLATLALDLREKKAQQRRQSCQTFRIKSVALDPARPRCSSLASGGSVSPRAHGLSRHDGWTWAAVAPKHQRQVKMKKRKACKHVREASGRRNNTSRSIFKKATAKVRGIVIVSPNPGGAHQLT